MTFEKMLILGVQLYIEENNNGVKKKLGVHVQKGYQLNSGATVWNVGVGEVGEGRGALNK